MKVLDFLLIIGAISLLIASYYLYSGGKAELGALATFFATLCGGVFGARQGGRIYKKNHDKKKKRNRS